LWKGFGVGWKGTPKANQRGLFRSGGLPEMSRRLSGWISFVLALGLSLTGVAVGDLIGWWAFDEGSGTVAEDASGGGTDLTLGNTTWAEGLFGSAVHFQGRGAGYAQRFRHSGNAITVCAWVWHDTFRAGQIERYVTLDAEAAVIRKEGDGRLHFYIQTGGNLRHLWVGNVLTARQWQYVAGTWDGITQRLYIDGEEIASQTPGGVLSNTINMSVSSGGEPLNGKLDEVRIYDRALGRAEIQALMQGEEQPFASNPIPADGATSVDVDVTLNWAPGVGAESHTVYLGASFGGVNDATQGVLRLTPNFIPEALEPDKTYYWRVDEFDGVESHKGEVWSFTTVRAGGGWTYEDGILVGAYYYPWYGPAAHRVSESLRGHLVPEQTSELGEYDCADAEVIARHIDYSHRANIHFWLCSWWGPGSQEDSVFRYRILRHRLAGELRYAILYESTGRLGSFANPDYTNLIPDIQYCADHFFDDPSYLKIDGRPVVFIYLTRVYFRSSPGYGALAALRAAFPDLYIIADDVFGHDYQSTHASKWDAVTAYDAYGQTLGLYGSTRAALDHLEMILSQAKMAAHSRGVGLIPFATPGFNDKAARSGHPGAPRYFVDEPTSVEGDVFRAMLRDVVVPKVDPLAANMLVVTSFNEWHEDTQIEPTIGTGDVTSMDDSASGRDYTEGDDYADYGYLYLDILAEETSVLVTDPLSEALDSALSFTTGGSAGWRRETSMFHEDGDAARSGEIADGEESWLRTTIRGGGTVRFYWMVSSESSYDFLEFYIDGSRRDRISGSVDRHEMAYELTSSGLHTLQWRYVKDVSADDGSDCGWVDKVVWVPAP
jgi:glycoprotein endo-alpha-1,2-mannosidase